MEKSSKKNLIEWGIILSLFFILYITGYHTEVIGRLQQMLLWTGIMQPDISLAPEEQLPADYNWSVISLEGEVIPLNYLKNKVIFINFWATWCPPCVAEMPDIHNLYKQIASDSIVFLMISVDDDHNKIRKFIKRKEFTFPVFQLHSHLPAVFHSGTIPTTYIVSPAGRIVSVRKGLAKYNTKKFRNFLTDLIHSHPGH